MTAEIAVMNKSAVALAADSAVTIRGGQIKVYNSVNKLFSLSKYHPIGVMIYGNAEIDGVPWESLIKLFRTELGDTHLDSVSSYAERFAEFLASNALAFPPKRQEGTVQSIAAGLASAVVDAIKSKVRSHLKTGSTYSQ